MTKLDRIDRRILAELQSDATISNLELAERVGLSPSPCSRRVRQLQERGLIDRTVTLLNRDKLDLTLTIYIQVHMANQLTKTLQNFELRVSEFDEVQECALVTGSDADYLLKVVMPDMAHYEKFLLKQLNQIDGVASIRTSFVLRQVLSRTELPLKHVN
ncbi:Lrp/AsnC family transcriptional regulator [Motiliproteus sp.]|uniref:Lrp/AsnC family transcriptional regulator n=1 Tax=Motiliproteus sp. TaxID=1898955 RepID=UPI003BAADEF6